MSVNPDLQLLHTTHLLKITTSVIDPHHSKPVLCALFHGTPMNENCSFQALKTMQKHHKCVLNVSLMSCASLPLIWTHIVALTAYLQSKEITFFLYSWFSLQKKKKIYVYNKFQVNANAIFNFCSTIWGGRGYKLQLKKKKRKEQKKKKKKQKDN